MNKKIDLITLSKESTLIEAMKRIEKSGLGMVAIVDREGKLLGVATDGDIRRALLAKENFTAPIKGVMITNPITAREGTPATVLLETMIEKSIQQIPILDAHYVLLDVVPLKELKSIPLSNPDITSKERALIDQVLHTPLLSIGPQVEAFEKKVAQYIGVKHAIAVNSGTSGLHLCIRSLGIKDGDEVITTPFSFIASANCVLFERAKPVFVDIERNTLCIDVSKIEEKITKKTKAILPVHIFGHSCDMNRIMEIAKQYQLTVIEDACEAIGAEYKGEKVGSFGRVGVFAFYPNKAITTSEGGVIVTNDEAIARLCRSMRNQGKDGLSHVRLGYNYRMPELSAALGVAQMERLEEILEKRKRVANSYNERLNNIEGIVLPCVRESEKTSWFVYVIQLDEERFSQLERDAILRELQNRGIQCKNYFTPIHREPFYQEMFGYQKGDFPIAETAAASTIALPFYNNLTEEDIDYISNNLAAVLKNVKRS